MPEADGIELVERARKVVPEINALVMSGYTATALSGRLEGVELLRKPLTPTRLATAVREALDQAKNQPHR